ncbi:hypothetical protein LCGC14_2257700 [marine sediment metagenome]|uniref:Uncharacterized protein n=1 Tax=marine sediment metagenome TaxID=412755 RepID=A0A0F9FVP5_9ZZZZ
MVKMRAVQITQWGEDGIQILFRTLSPVAAFEVDHTERAMPTNVTEFTRLQAVHLYDEFDVTTKKSA